MNADPVLVRQAREDDGPAIGRIASANGQPLEDSGSDPRYVRHLTTHGRLLVAYTADTGVTAATAGTGGRLTGFAATRQIGSFTLLCDLFVDPASHGRGVGRKLLDRIFEGTGDRVTFSSQDPRALPLYARYGLAPRWPLLYLAGNPASAVAAVLRTIPTIPAMPARLAEAGQAAAAERRLTGVERGPDYLYWGSLPGSGGIVVGRDVERDSVVAAGATGPAELRHLAVRDGADPAAAVMAALAVFGSSVTRLCLPGPHPALGALLSHGFRVEDYDHYMSTGPDLIHSGDVLSPALG